MKGMFRFLTFTAALLIATQARAGQPEGERTLDSLVALALERNLSVAAARYQAEADLGRSRYAGWLPDPQLSVGLMNLPGGALDFDRTMMSGIQVGLSQGLPWPGKLSARSKIADLTVERSRADAAIQENALVRMVTVAYANYSYWALSREVLDENLRLVRDLKTVAETNYANGRGSAQDVLRTETAMARLENRILMADQQRSSALVELARLTNSPDLTAASLPPYLAAADQQADSADQEFSAVANPAAVRAAYQTDIMSGQVDLAHADYWPDFMLGVDYTIRQETPMDAVRGQDYLTFKVGLKLPLWFFKRQKNQSAAAGQMLLATRATEESVNDELERRHADVVLALRSLSERLKQYDNAIMPQARAAFEAAEIAYEVGKVDFNGLLATERDLLEIELERLDLLRSHMQQQAMLKELTTGFETR